MRILYATDFLPHERSDHGGGKMLHWFIEEMRSRGHSVSLIALCQPKDAPFIEEVRSVMVSAEIVVVENTRPRRLRSFLGGLFQTEARAYCLSAGLDSRARAFLARQDFDVIHAVHPWMIRIMADALPARRKARTRLIGHVVDVSTEVLRRKIAKRPAVRLLKEYLWSATTEDGDYALCDALLAHTASDRDVIASRRRQAPPTFLIPVWFDAMDRLVDQAGSRATSEKFIVVGTSSDPRMREGVDWLVSAVWPEVLQRHPAATLDLISVRPEHQGKWKNQPGVVARPYVDDLIAEYDQAKALLFPLRSGGYSRHLKLLNAMARGCPVILTAEANTSERLKDGLDGLIRNDANGFIEAIEGLWRDPDLGCRLASAALDRVRSDYGGLNMAEALLVLYASTDQRLV